MVGSYFSESQFQYLVNSEIERDLRKEGVKDPFPRIVSTRVEGSTGWDSAFSLP